MNLRESSALAGALGWRVLRLDNIHLRLHQLEMNNEPQRVKTAWKKYPDAKPPKQHGLEHWEDQSELVLCVVDDGMSSTRLSTGRLHGLWDDGCGIFVAEEWRNEVGIVINVIYWMEMMPKQVPDLCRSAIPEELRESPRAKVEGGLTNAYSHGGQPKPQSFLSKLQGENFLLMIPMLALFCITTTWDVVKEAWRMLKEIWNRYIKP